MSSSAVERNKPVAGRNAVGLLRRQISTEHLPAGAFGAIRTWKARAGSGVVAVRPDSGLGAVRRAPTRRPLGVLAHLDASVRVRMAASAVAGRRSRAAQQARCIREKAC